ncbi:11791_t:CDS:1, partial [Dentiscutata heterogama]
VSINEKIDQYKCIIDNDTTIASILDSRTKLLLFEIEQETTDAVNQTREVFSQYYTKFTNKPLYVKRNDISTTRDYFKGLKQHHLESDSRTNQDSMDELEQYLALSCDKNVALLL